jgi:hypothetical protein
LGFPKFFPDHEAPKAEGDSPHHRPKALDGEILSPEPRQPMPAFEKSPEEIFVELRAMKIEPSTTKALPAPSPEPDRGGPDFEP